MKKIRGNTVGTTQRGIKDKLDRIKLDGLGNGADPEWHSTAYDNIGTHTGVYVEHMGNDGKWRTILRRANNASLSTDGSVEKFKENIKSSRIPITNSDGRLEIVAPDQTCVSEGSSIASINTQNCAIPLHYADKRYTKLRESDTTYEVAYTRQSGGTETTKILSAGVTDGKQSIPIRDKTSQNFHVGLASKNNHPVNSNYLASNLSLNKSGNDTIELSYTAPEKVDGSKKVSLGAISLPQLTVPLVPTWTLEPYTTRHTYVDANEKTKEVREGMCISELINSTYPNGKGFKTSFMGEYFNRLPVVGDVFTGAGRTPLDGTMFHYTAKVDRVDEKGGAFFTCEEIIPMPNPLALIEPLVLSSPKSDVKVGYTNSMNNFNRPPVKGEIIYGTGITDDGYNFAFTAKFTGAYGKKDDGTWDEFPDGTRYADVYKVGVNSSGFAAFQLTSVVYTSEVDRAKNVGNLQNNDNGDNANVDFTIGDRRYKKAVNNVALAKNLYYDGVPKGTDLNRVLDRGLYMCYLNGNYANYPLGDLAGWLEVKSTTGWYIQTLTTDESVEWTRSCHTGEEWTEWKRFATAEELAEEITADTTPTYESERFVTSGGVFAALPSLSRSKIDKEFTVGNNRNRFDSGVTRPDGKTNKNMYAISMLLKSPSDSNGNYDEVEVHGMRYENANTALWKVTGIIGTRLYIAQVQIENTTGNEVYLYITEFRYIDLATGTTKEYTSGTIADITIYFC